MSDISKKPDDNYDRGIEPAETAAREKREGSDFKEMPDKPAEDEIDTTAGATVDREGLANNYAVEPEMYVNEPGDLREKEAQKEAERAEELEEVNEPGGKGPGVI
ncbi:hypothetical protein [Myxosarcina sp. GI1]|uniref:hypothetical protein n=1 Tax=Myxosarcina sp. GI1 TaxID=1541065 RepID=UPI0005615B4E|nr:hypothetical protein [Myxosarcina sp. GI1]